MGACEWSYGTSTGTVQYIVRDWGIETGEWGLATRGFSGCLGRSEVRGCEAWVEGKSMDRMGF